MRIEILVSNDSPHDFRTQTHERNTYELLSITALQYVMRARRKLGGARTHEITGGGDITRGCRLYTSDPMYSEVLTTKDVV